ncbi:MULTISPECIES: tyrosine-type recombinase/integrase [Mycobacteroides]|uniref:Site-specific integrase n=1 Tax=Mycobacteroides franklinii TaxID=948102 RepID=A0A4R5PHA3_9MYCO|nr:MULTISPECIES: site-specific integrase [Mycobacteroides]AMU71476.1 integrase [Mycobacteroides abscessus]MDM2015324.1 site-specific integrase [Mycobacteroides abscessus]MDM2019702.1 site-specific integrase [Mycobacteroides abscessus]MDM2025089.1 site-specific integrase [Mycobacteroides abscessus]MDM2027760.1 site-specific integrase [Mycobacteroides abscessus]
MASIRSRSLKSGDCWDVLYRLGARQFSLTFETLAGAEAFRALVDAHGALRALEMHNIAPPAPRSGMTVGKWVSHHIEHLTGVDPRTVQDYRGYLKNDIEPAFGTVPLEALSREDVSVWVQGLGEKKYSAKTIANKHGFLSAALATAVVAGKIASNPADRTRLPRGEGHEMVFLTKEEFAHLNEQVTEPWRPMAEFLVASGARWGEVSALRPSDVDQRAHTVRITRAWKRDNHGYRIGPPKTKRSVRTINVPADVLDKLDYSGAWLFTNTGRGRRAEGGPVRAPNFRMNVWAPAVLRAELDPKPRIHDMRHTCASWLIAAGVPLPVIQQHLGHESITTTVNTYGHLDRSSMEAAAVVMAKALSS